MTRGGPSIILALATAANACASSPSPVAPQVAAAPIEQASAKRRERIVLMEVDAYRAPLFRDELASLRRSAFQLLANRPELGELVTFEETERLLALAHEGRAVEGGPVCAAAPAFHELVRSRYRAALEARVGADCYERPCKLDVSIVRPPQRAGPYEDVARWTASVDDPLSIASWNAAFAALKQPPPPQGSGGLSLSAGDTDPRLVQIDHAQPFGVWAVGGERDLAQEFRTIQPALDACHAFGWSSSQTEHGSLEVKLDGSIGRCDLALDEDRGRARERETCLCGAFSRVRFEPSSGARRLALSFINHTSSVVKREGVRYFARFEQVKTDPRWEVRPHLGGAVRPFASCHASTGARGLVRIPVRLEVDAVGHVTSASSGAYPAQPCIEEALRHVAFTCPPSAAATTVAAQLVLHTEER